MIGKKRRGEEATGEEDTKSNGVPSAEIGSGYFRESIWVLLFRNLLAGGLGKPLSIS